MRVDWTYRRFGYLVWGALLILVVGPELAAVSKTLERHLPFPTISRTIGHLEAVNSLWEIFPTALVVLFVYALVRSPVPVPAGTTRPLAPAPTHGARIGKVWLFLGALVAAAAFLGVSTWLASRHWPDQPNPSAPGKLANFYVAYWIWGWSLVLWVVAPTVFALVAPGRLPSVPQTVVNALRYFNGRSWPVRLGQGLSWSLGFALIWGMAFLLLHLTLYPFPSIARELNRKELTCTVGGAPHQIVSRIAPGDTDCAIGGYDPSSGG